MSKQNLKDIISELVDEELEEMTTTGNIDGYNTPFAFDPTGDKIKKKFKSKKNSHREKIGEALESKDLDIIKKLIRAVVGDIIRDIWLKRNAWNK